MVHVISPSTCIPDILYHDFVAPQPRQYVLLTFQNFDTECGFDYLKIYDGSSKQRLLGSFSGNTIPQSLTSNTTAVSNMIFLAIYDLQKNIIYLYINIVVHTGTAKDQ